MCVCVCDLEQKKKQIVQSFSSLEKSRSSVCLLEEIQILTLVDDDYRYVDYCIDRVSLNDSYGFHFSREG